MSARIFSSLIGFALVLGLSGEPAQAQQNQSPREGKYLILSYGAVSRPPLVLGHFTLEKGGVYKVFLVGGRQVGEGRYTLDAASNVQWIDGPYAGEFGGQFSTDNDGRTHKIRLRRTTIGTNSQ
jgi:hypothetical protein